MLMGRIPNSISNQSVWSVDVGSEDTLVLVTNGRVDAVTNDLFEKFKWGSLSNLLQWVHEQGGKSVCVETKLIG